MLEDLKASVCEANKLLPRYGLVKFTWGNVSAISPDRQYIVIKPSGVPYEDLAPEKMVVVSMTGETVEGNLSPSSDTKTHLEIYRAFSDVYGVTHTHSHWATAYAQAGRDIPCYGTTHADFAYGGIPCVRHLTEEELLDYERNTGIVLTQWFEEHNLSYKAVPGALCASHGVFTWGKSVYASVENAAILEEVAALAAHTEQLCADAQELPMSYQNKHYFRKHGEHAYYGQPKCEFGTV